jgi:hypothetical protein
VCTFCSTLLDNWAKGRSSHILPRHYRDADKHFFNKIITGDEACCFACDPETKRQGSECFVHILFKIIARRTD